MHKYSRRASLKIGAAAVAGFAAAIGTGNGQSFAGDATEPPPAEPAEPVFPRPGGGPRAIHTVVTFSDGAYLLDTARGEYRKLPHYNLMLSPDERMVAVEGEDGRIGVAEREALLRTTAAVRWTGLPPGSPCGWSPDGRALLVTTLDKETWRFTAHRYDLGTNRIWSTPINLDTDAGTAGWAADSVRYVVQLRGPDPQIPDGPMQYLNPDGAPGPLVGTSGRIWNADSYSPSRRYAIVEPSRPYFPDETADWQRPKIFDLLTGKVVSTMVPDWWPVVGWYDDRHVVRIEPSVDHGPVILEVLDIYTGEVTKQVPAPGVPPYRIQLGSSAKLQGRAAEFGF